VFFDELGDLLDCVATFAEPVYILGDCNVRLDRADDVHASRIMDFFNSYGLDLRVEWSDSSSRWFTGCRGLSQ
jgi:hypothetical protein